jgi:hypothetical protein
MPKKKVTNETPPTEYKKILPIRTNTNQYITGMLLDTKSKAPLDGYIVRVFLRQARGKLLELGRDKTDDKGRFNFPYQSLIAKTAAKVASQNTQESKTQKIVSVADSFKNGDFQFKVTDTLDRDCAPVNFTFTDSRNVEVSVPTKPLIEKPSLLQKKITDHVQRDFLNMVSLGLKADLANSRKTIPNPPAELAPKINECKDCESVLSPASYLADLLEYAVTHIRNGKKDIDLKYLSDTFCQPFSDIPASCESVNKELLQARICVEVLRSYLNKHLIDDAAILDLLKRNENAYHQAAFLALLTHLGTFYDEIRIATSWERKPGNEEDRGKYEDLASRLQIGVDDLYHFLDNFKANLDDLSEEDLEKWFGLVNSKRDPLSDGIVLGKDRKLITRWNLDGVLWNRNTDSNGCVFLRLTKTAEKAFSVEAFKSKDRVRESLLAKGECSITSAVSVHLDEENDSGLSGEIEFNKVRATEEIQLSVFPRILSWRLKQLRELWFKEDWPADLPKDGKPLIDPDVIGPDDFRTPDPANNAFKLWLGRRKWVDQQIADLIDENATKDVAGINSMFALMATAIDYQGTKKTPWPVSAAIQPEDFDSILQDVSHGIEVEKHKQDLQNDLNLDIDEFSRLMAIKAKCIAYEKDPRKEAVQDDEWSEFYSILVQIQKAKVYDTWRDEEKDIQFVPTDFWISLREPTEGNWPPVIDDTQPYIDPETTKLADLPDLAIGKGALDLWNRRKEQLSDIKKKLKEKHGAAGFEEMMKLALGDPNPGDELPNELEYYKDQLAQLDPIESKKAEEKIIEELLLSIDSFTRLLDIKRKDQPTDSEWNEVYSILTTAQKKKYEFTQWCQEEIASQMRDQYWTALKARLPRWRANYEVRQQWQQALRQRISAPIIDPDQIGPADLVNPCAGNAFDLWNERYNQIHDRTTGLLALLKHYRENTADPLTGFNFIIKKYLGIERDELTRLEEDREEGNDIQKRLDQLGLSTESFNCLIRIPKLVKVNILASEWDEVYAILAQIIKQRLYTEWREREKQFKLTLSPDNFRFPAVDITVFPPPAQPELLPWLASRSSRQDWQDKLQSRIDQEQAVINGYWESIRAVEEATITKLRDALIIACGSLDLSLDLKAKSLAKELLIDTKMGSCQKTTRVAQAIETVQNFIFSIRNGLLGDIYKRLTLETEYFEEEWEWLGSYATYRAAMFVFIYPENILIPSLKSRITPMFSELIQSMRSGRKVTPAQALAVAKKYSDYFEDVCSLTLEAFVKVYGKEENVQAGTLPDIEYYFAKGGKTNTIYMSRRDPNAPTIDKQSFWELVPGFIDYLGPAIAAPLTSGLQERFIQFIAWVNDKGEKKLKCALYDLDQGIWKDEPQDVEIADEKLVEIAAIDPIAFYAYTWPAPGTVPLYGLSRQPYGHTYYTVRTEVCDFLKSLEEEGWEDLGIICYVLDSQKEAAVSLRHCRKYYHPSTGESRFWHYYAIDASLIETALANNWEESTDPSEIYIFSYQAPGTSPIYRIRMDNNEINGVSHFNGDLASATGDMKSVLYITQGNFKDVKFFSVPVSMDEISPLIDKRIIEGLNEGDPHTKALKQKLAFTHKQNSSISNRVYLEEAFYFAPIHLALQLQAAGEYCSALDWFRTVYDYKSASKIYYGLILEEDLGNVYARAEDWLLDPLNPHAIASTRTNTYTRFTQSAIIRCLLEYADAEFTRDTSESVPRARELYLKALELLNSEELKEEADVFDELLTRVETQIIDMPWKPIIALLKTELLQIDDIEKRKAAIKDVTDALSMPEPWLKRITAAKAAIGKARKGQLAPMKFSSLLEDKNRKVSQLHTQLSRVSILGSTTERLRMVAGEDFIYSVSGVTGFSKAAIKIKPSNVSWLDTLPARDDTENVLPFSLAKARTKVKVTYVPSPYHFCIPHNPVSGFLRLHAELNLYKIRTCRNIAGVKRELDPYAAPTDMVSGMPMIGVGGQLMLPGITVIKPTPYRYPVLIERSKQLAQMAAQFEAAMLSAMEKYDAESFSLLKARQEMGLTCAGVQLQSLRVKEARDGVKLAELQKDRAQIQKDYYKELINQGWLVKEQIAIGLMIAAAAAETAAMGVYFYSATTVGGGGASAVASGLSALAETNSMTANILMTFANHERQMDEWKFQRDLADQDFLIANQQITLAKDQERIIGQEKIIAEMQADNAKDVVEFLANKFTNAELYDWMGNILEGIYSFFLQQATSMAKLAENQLAFDRQETPQAIIQADYWEASAEGSLSIGTDKGPDRRGLTGPARLLQDITRLDAYAFETNQRKLQLTKTFSLARQFPVEFQRFLETGVMNFATSMEIFDHDFPGHYLRQVKRIRTSVIALIPPVQGIKATLTNSGISRVVIKGDLFQTVPVHYGPDYVALTSPINATGLFEMEQQTEMRVPFEGIGVNTMWEFGMSKAANSLDYSTIADILFTVDYTALNDSDYQQQVLQTLNPRITADRPFSFRHELSDQWYDLHNPDRSDTPMVVTFETRREDFPPNIRHLKIQNIVLFFARGDSESFEVPVDYLRYIEQGSTVGVGGSATTIDGIIRGNTCSWSSMIGKSPIGKWELALPAGESIKKLFGKGKDGKEQIADVLFVITYSGETPK